MGKLKKQRKGGKGDESDSEAGVETKDVIDKTNVKKGGKLLNTKLITDASQNSNEKDIGVNENDEKGSRNETDQIDNTLTKMPSEENEKVNDKSNKKSKKARRKKNDSDEDIEKALAELELEYSGVKTIEPESSGGKNQFKGKVKETGAEDDNVSQQKECDKQKKKASSSKEGISKKQNNVNLVEKMKTVGDEQENQVEDTEKESKKKKKKNAKDKEEKDVKDTKESKKGPGKKTIAAMQEALKKIKEEEEKQQKLEEERIRKEEEAEVVRLEALRLEQEKKERKKQKEKEKKERLKAEGKLLTAKQKADRARAQAMIDSLKAQGVELPDVGERKLRPGTRIRPNKQKKEQNQAPSQEAIPLEKSEPEVETPKNDNDPVKEESGDDIKDAWDASSDEEISEPKSPLDGGNSVADIKGKKEEDGETSEEETDNDVTDESDSNDEDDDLTNAERIRIRALERIKKRKEEAEKNKIVDNLRAAIVCVLGHVDTGKTKILDKLRRTNVQDGEAGGITQQIGATNVPIEAIKEQIKIVKEANDLSLKIPGLLIIDTPGHESFSNLRNRGSSLCDIAILVVDIMHGLEPQTIESINILKSKKTPFIVALNKIDRLYDWQTMNRKDVRDILKVQNANTQLEFEQRTKDVILQFAEQGLNAALFYENPDIRSYVSLVPTSAITGEGMGNLLALIVDFCQTKLSKRLMYSDELQATVLEVKAISGLGTTIDVILVNGTLKEGDTMLCAGTDGPIVTQIRSLLMPQPLRELRVKNAYVEYREIKAAQGVKIAAKDLEKAIAGLNLYVAQKPDEVEILKDEVSKELRSALSKIKLVERGVYVQASTLGSLEALLEFLRTSKIPYSGIRIGPVVKKDVMKASIMLEHESQYATILAFDVKVEKDAQDLADSVGVKIFQADIIYHLFDKFMAYREELKQKKREEFKHIAVFPCKIKVLPQFVFNSRDPIVVGVMVEAGIIKEGTPICVPSQEFVDLGIVTSIESNHKPVETARKGMEVCIKIEPIPGESPKMFGRHFDETDMLISKISRQSIDACKDYFRDDLLKTDWQLMVELKKLFQIL